MPKRLAVIAPEPPPLHEALAAELMRLGRKWGARNEQEKLNALNFARNPTLNNGLRHALGDGGYRNYHRPV